MECWSNGVLDCWSVGKFANTPTLQYSSIPFLHYSVTPQKVIAQVNLLNHICIRVNRHYGVQLFLYRRFCSLTFKDNNNIDKR